MARAFVAASTQNLISTTTPIPSQTYPVSMSAWVKSDSLTLNQVAVSLGDSSAPDDISLMLRGNTAGDYVRASTWDGAAGYFAATTAAYSINVWQHICGTFTNGGEYACYLNGGNKGTYSDVAAEPTWDRVSIGCHGDNSPGNYMSGLIAETAIWNVSLTDAEVAILSTGISPLTIRPGNLVFYVPLVRDNDEDIINGISLSPVNSPTISDHAPIYYPFTPFYYMVSGAEPPADLSIDIGLDEAAYQGTGVRII